MTKEEALAVLLASPEFDHVGKDGRHCQNKLGKFYKEYDDAYSWACFPYADDGDPSPDYAFEISVIKDYIPNPDYGPVIPASAPIPEEEARALWIEDSPTHLLSIDEAKARGSSRYAWDALPDEFWDAFPD